MALAAESSIEIDASPDRVWEALISPEAIHDYFFGTNVQSTWREGEPIVWRGEWQGSTYEDHGTLLTIAPPTKLQYTHFSPLTGQDDVPENYHTITVDLAPISAGTLVSLSQDNCATEEGRDHSAQNWGMVLDGLKRYVERVSASPPAPASSRKGD